VPWWRSAWFDVVQFLILVGLIAWLAWRGAGAMGYRWQWYRVPRFFYRYVDGVIVWARWSMGSWSPSKSPPGGWC
jgi:polar amino acid transport system permease protein